MLIYVSKQFTAAATGSVFRTVHCERCSQPYAYELARVGIGRGAAPYYINQSGAQKRADRAAKKDLAKRLSRDEEAVPCPACGWIQDSMVRSIRSQKYRGLVRLVSIGLPAILAILFFAGLFTYLDRYAKPGQLIPILQLAVGAVTVAVAILAFRSFLLSRIDPNHLFPQRPVVTPGTPPALIPDGAGEVERLVPASIEQIEQPDDWVEVQFQRCILPEVCCECLGPHDRVFQTPLADNDNLAVPLCRACYRKIVWRWWRWTGISILLALTVAGAIVLSMRKGDAFGRWFLFGLIGLFGSVLTMAALPRMMVKPYRIKVLDSERGVVRLKFRNPQYTRLLMEAYYRRSNLEPPSSAK